MARAHFLAALFLLVVVGVAAEEAQASEPPKKPKKAEKPKEPTCDAAEVAQLKAEIAELKKKLAEPAAPKEESFSVLAAGKRLLGISSAVTEHALAQTTVDEQVLGHIDTARTHVAKAYDQVASVDYNGVVEQVKSTLAPHIDAATTAAKPLMDQYVTPALEKASVQLEPHMKTAKEAYDSTSKTVQDSVMPALKKSSSQVFDVVADSDKHVEKAHSLLGDLMMPIFDRLNKIAPGHDLPKSPVDRLLFLLVSAFIGYHFFFMALRVARWAFIILRLKFKIAFKGGVVLPLKILKFALSMFFFFATGFYCCGLCRSKKSIEAKAKGDADAKKEAKKKATAATAAELQELLNIAKKEKKLEPAAQQLVKLEKTGDAMKQPKHMAGKTVTKDALKKAIGHFGELDAKKLLK